MANVPYASVVRSLMYAMVGTRADIAHAVGVLSRYMLTPGREHRTIVKKILRYLRGMIDYAFCYQGKPRFNKQVQIHGFLNSYWVGDVDRRQSTNWYVFNLHGGVVSWMSRRQSIIALSTIEVEYMVATHASK